jgi:hypothetical protein
MANEFIAQRDVVNQLAPEGPKTEIPISVLYLKRALWKLGNIQKADLYPEA